MSGDIRFVASHRRMVGIYVGAAIVLVAVMLVSSLLLAVGAVSRGPDLSLVAGLFIGAAIGSWVTLALLKTETDGGP